MLNALRWTVYGGRPGARPVRRAAPHRVPRPAGAGRDEERVPQHRLHAGASARRQVHRLAHDGRARRALPARDRGGRAVRLRVLPGRRLHRARVRPARPRLRRASSAAADAIVGALLDVLPDARALLVTADHGQVHLERDSWIAIPELGAMTTRDGGRRSLPLPLRAQGRGPRTARRRARTGSVIAAWVWSRAEVLDEGLLGAGATGTRARAARRRGARRARRRRLRRSRAAATRCSCDRATARSPPTRCSSRSSPPPAAPPTEQKNPRNSCERKLRPATFSRTTVGRKTGAGRTFRANCWEEFRGDRLWRRTATLR